MKVSSDPGTARSLREAGKRRANARRGRYGRAMVDFALLGSMEVRRDGAALELGGLRQRSLLALLVLHANELVATDRLVDELWGDDPPDAAVKTVQVYVARLRKLLGAGSIVTRPPGYELGVAPEAIDVTRFEALAGEGRRALAAGDPATASRRLAE